jgi:hypothetical protein
MAQTAQSSLVLRDSTLLTTIPDAMTAAVRKIAEEQCLHLKNGQAVPFDALSDICFQITERLPHHSNGMRFSAFGPSGANKRSIRSAAGGS